MDHRLFAQESGFGLLVIYIAVFYFLPVCLGILSALVAIPVALSVAKRAGSDKPWRTTVRVLYFVLGITVLVQALWWLWLWTIWESKGHI